MRWPKFLITNPHEGHLSETHPLGTYFPASTTIKIMNPNLQLQHSHTSQQKLGVAQEVARPSDVSPQKSFSSHKNQYPQGTFLHGQMKKNPEKLVN
jgi:hypothetical protein